MAFAVIGHSFIARIQDHYFLKFDSIPTYFLGLRGSTTRRLLRSDRLEEIMLSNRPTRIFLQIGGNDIGPTSTAYRVYKDIKNLINELKTVDSVKRIVVGCLFKRYKPRGMSSGEYEQQRVDVNRLLKERYEGDSIVTFCDLHGLCDLDRDAFPDGVHLDEAFHDAYAGSIRLALLSET